MMRKGQRVRVQGDNLPNWEGEKGTVRANPDTGKHQDRGFAWVVFDNPRGNNELIPQWVEKKYLGRVRSAKKSLLPRRFFGG